jgi:hypothetical protein
MPEILPPESSELSTSRGSLASRSTWQEATRFEKGVAVCLSAGFLFSVFMFALGQFFQVRGVQNMLTSRIFLVVAWTCATLLLWGLGRALISRWVIVGCVGTIILLAATIALDYVFPMPRSLAKNKHTSPSPSNPLTQKVPTQEKEQGRPLSSPSNRPRTENQERLHPKTTGNVVVPSAKDASGIPLLVSLVNPSDVAVVVENPSDSLAQEITWHLVMFRTSDQAFFSYVGQSGYSGEGER